jgi:hypothetical protein
MEPKNYLLINLLASPAVCENAIVWDGDVNKWKPEDGYLALPAETTVAADWSRNSVKEPWALVDQIGAGRIGYTWDGQRLVTNQPEPFPVAPTENQPAQSGAEQF